MEKRHPMKENHFMKEKHSMKKYNRKNLKAIQTIVQEKTGAAIVPERIINTRPQFILGIRFFHGIHFFICRTVFCISTGKTLRLYRLLCRKKQGQPLFRRESRPGIRSGRWRFWRAVCCVLLYCVLLHMQSFQT